MIPIIIAPNPHQIQSHSAFLLHLQSEVYGAYAEDTDAPRSSPGSDMQIPPPQTAYYPHVRLLSPLLSDMGFLPCARLCNEFQSFGNTDMIQNDRASSPRKTDGLTDSVIFEYTASATISSYCISTMPSPSKPFSSFVENDFMSFGIPNNCTSI